MLIYCFIVLVLPAKIAKTENKVSSNGEKIPVLGSTSAGDVKTNNNDNTGHYQYGNYSQQPTTPNFPPTYSANVPIRASSSYPQSYSSAPATGSQYYQPPPGHQNYYPPAGPS